MGGAILVNVGSKENYFYEYIIVVPLIANHSMFDNKIHIVC